MGFESKFELYFLLFNWWCDLFIAKEDKQIRPDGESTSANVSPQIKMCTSRYYQTIDVSPAPIKFPVS